MFYDQMSFLGGLPLYIIGASCFDMIRNYYSSVYKSDKLGINFAASNHALISSSLSLFYLVMLKYFNYNYNSLGLIRFIIQSISSSYFLYDSVVTIETQNGIMKYAYLYHHFSSIYILHLYFNIFPTVEGIFLAELSNLPSYVVYYLKKQVPVDKERLSNWRLIQNFLYGIIRIPLIGGYGGFYFYNNFSKKNLINYLIVSPVYLMGLVWTGKLLFKD